MNPTVKRIIYGLVGFFAAFAAALSAMDGGGSLKLSQIGDVPLLSWIMALTAFFTGYLNENSFSGKPKTTATLLVLFFMPFMIGCASVVTPQTMEQQIFAAESSLPTVAKITTDLLIRDRITIKQAKEIRGELDKAKQAIEISKLALSKGERGEAQSNLQTAATILQALEKALQAAQTGSSLDPPITT